MNDWIPYYFRSELKHIQGSVYLNGEHIADYEKEHPVNVTYIDEQQKEHTEKLGEKRDEL